MSAPAPSPAGAPPASESPPEAVTLEQHAGIAVALAEGFARADVLAQEQLDEATFRPADVEWKRRLVEDARGEGELFARYQAKRAEAEDWLCRKVTPLDEDLAAWLGFLKEWSASERPFELLSRAGLSLADVGRLGRAWQSKLADEKLAKRAAKLAPEAKMPARVTVEPGKLRPFPWSPKSRPKPVTSPAAVEVSASALEDIPEVAVVAVTPSYLRDPSPPLAAAAFAGGAPGAPPSTGRALPSYARNIPADGTSPVFYLRGGDGLPFSDSGSDTPVVATAPVEKKLEQQSGETVMAFELPKGMAIPFGAKPPPAPERAIPPAQSAAPAAHAGPASPLSPAPPVMGTVAVFELPRGPALPFAPKSADSPTAAKSADSPTAAKSADSPAAAKSADSPAAPKSADSAAAPKSTDSPVAPRSAVPSSPTAGLPPVPPVSKAPLIGGTLPLDAKITTPSLPFRTDSPRRDTAPPSAHPARQSLSLEDHAALCAEIALRPAKAAEALARRGLDSAAKTALDAHFNTVRAADPTAESAWTKAYQSAYTKLLLSSWKGT